MAAPSNDPTPWGALGPDPGRAVRCWVALLLRFGIGLPLLGSGLAGYFELQGPGGGMNSLGQNATSPMLVPLFAALPYVAIGLGLALILGFLTKPAAIASGFFSLLMPIFSIIEIVAVGRSNPGGWQFYTPTSGNASNLAVLMTMSLPSLLAYAAMIWLSPLENHPYSIDTLIFGRNEVEAPPPAPEPLPLPEIPAGAGDENTIVMGD